LGLLAFSLDLERSGGDAAYVEVDYAGVALVNGAVDPGRRRFNLAHELGHHLVGDAYAPELTVVDSDETERYLNAFAAHLLMPREPVTTIWNEYAEGDARMGAVAIAVRYRVSWGAVCTHLRNLDVITRDEMEALQAMPPSRADFLELGEMWQPELEPPSVPPGYGRWVVSAFRAGKLTSSKTVELLWGTVGEGELGERQAIPLEGLTRSFDTLP
jgi:hypothetical protein